MEIRDNKIIGVDFRRSPNTSGFIKEHKVITLHHCSGFWEGTTSWVLNPQSKVSYHDYISKEGEERQFVEFHRRAYHAGVSEWKGLKNLNDWGVGVCFQNRGTEAFTDSQVEKGIIRCKSLIETYGYEDIARHRDIAPSRRNDPHNLFPWEEFKREVFSRSNIKATNTKKVTATGLNLRTTPDSSRKNNVVEVLKNGTEVDVIRVQGDWSEVFVCSIKKHGWVFSQHIR